MEPLQRLRFLLRITRSSDIARRYFVVNGFDGALALLGMLTGFYMASQVALPVIIVTCLGAAIALAASGLASAYISESAERRRALTRLEASMLSDLGESAHAQASRVVPLVIAVVNGLAPFLISLLIITPLWLAEAGVWLPAGPLESAMGMALLCIFALGIFMGRISGSAWLWSGIKSVLLAVITVLIILIVGQGGDMW